MQERSNPFYRLLLVISFVFVLTALAYALLPWKNQPEWLRQHGWQALLAELAGIIVFGLLSMILDRIRSLRGRSGQGSRVRDQDAGGTGRTTNPLGEAGEPR